MMKEMIRNMLESKRNFVFVGEAGSGKTEMALNFALLLHEISELPVHFFDMDMTKPLFRARDVTESIRERGIAFHFEQQFADAPTMVGGVEASFKDSGQITILDVGGDYIGARAVGGFSGWMNREETDIIYVLNVYRPWSSAIEAIDRTMGQILGVSRIRPEKLLFAAKPNVGKDTRAEEFAEGWRKTEEMISPYCGIAFAGAGADIAEEASSVCPVPVMPMKLFLSDVTEL